MTLAAAPAAAPTAGVVAKIGEQSYATLDEAIAAAKSGDTIVLVANATSQGISMKGDLVINGAGNTITFEKDGIAIFNHALTFKDAIASMMGIGSTPYAEWKWMAICANKDGLLTLDNTAMALDGTGTASGTHAIYFTSNNKLNVTNGSTLVVSNYPQDALEWDGGDGGYNLNVTGGSKVVLDHNRSGIAGTFFVKVDASELAVINNRGNGSNGSHFDIANGSEVSFKDNGSHGLSAGKLFVKGSTVTCTGNGLYGITVSNSLNVDGASTLKVNGNKTKASASSGGGLRITKNAKENFIAKGAVVEINNNGGNGLENYADLFSKMALTFPSSRTTRRVTAAEYTTVPRVLSRFLLGRRSITILRQKLAMTSIVLARSSFPQRANGFWTRTTMAWVIMPLPAGSKTVLAVTTLSVGRPMPKMKMRTI